MNCNLCISLGIFDLHYGICRKGKCLFLTWLMQGNYSGETSALNIELIRKMKKLIRDVLGTKISAFTGRSLLFHFPVHEFFSMRFDPFVTIISHNGHNMSWQMVNTVLNNQRFNQQSNHQQQIRIT